MLCFQTLGVQQRPVPCFVRKPPGFFLKALVIHLKFQSRVLPHQGQLNSMLLPHLFTSWAANRAVVENRQRSKRLLQLGLVRDLQHRRRHLRLISERDVLWALWVRHEHDARQQRGLKRIFVNEQNRVRRRTLKTYARRSSFGKANLCC